MDRRSIRTTLEGQNGGGYLTPRDIDTNLTKVNCHKFHQFTNNNYAAALTQKGRQRNGSQ